MGVDLHVVDVGHAKTPFGTSVPAPTGARRTHLNPDGMSLNRLNHHDNSNQFQST